MNPVSIILVILILAALIMASVRVWKNRGKCGCCGGDCAHCGKKL